MGSNFEITFPLELTHDGLFSITFTLQKGHSLEFGSGIYYLHGDNGSGKTTFLNLLALTAGTIGHKIPDNHGVIKFNGMAYSAKGFTHLKAAEIREKNFCIFPQKAFFLPVSTRDNYIILNGSDKQKAASFSSQEYPDLLSGGQQQKVLMDIVLDQKKVVWFLDEPLTNLDGERRQYFWMTLKRAYQKRLKTIFFIDHWMGQQIKNDNSFCYSNTLRVVTQNLQGSKPPEIESKSIDIYANRDPKRFFEDQLYKTEKDKSTSKMGDAFL